MPNAYTIGFISTWPIYQSTTIDRYAHSMIQGINAAAQKNGCNLLIGAGFGINQRNTPRRSFWPIPGPGVDFVPVGPWNTDGLIIVPDELTEEQLEYVHNLLDSGFPIIFTTPEGPGHLVKVDNTLGIQQAFNHLLEHGHRQIAFIAGNANGRGDSMERLTAYRSSLQRVGLPQDERLIAFGEHRKEDGANAMQQILDTGAPFTALIASNDLSCLGAIECLRKAGRKIPDDVAVIGFDDILDARSHSPSLTTVRHPTFSLGYQSVLTLLDYIHGNQKEKAHVVVPTRLIIRKSCGCQPVENNELSRSDGKAEPPPAVSDLVAAMAGAAFFEAHNSSFEEINIQCVALVDALIDSLEVKSADIIMKKLGDVLAWGNERGEDPEIWQAGFIQLYKSANALLQFVEDIEIIFLTNILDRISLEISNEAQRWTTRSMLEHMDMMAHLGMITAEMLTAMSIPDIAEILARSLPLIGIENILVAIYDEDHEGIATESEIILSAGLPEDLNGRKFETCSFPAADIYPPEQSRQLTILPLHVDNNLSGFVAFSASNPELCAAIVHNLAAALRTIQLYNDALEGRRMAEEANQMKSRFLSTVSHELRTPLSIIVGLSEMVMREEKAHLQSSSVNLRDIEQINTSAQHLARLIGDVLDLASSEAGQLHILNEPIDLSEVLLVATKIGEELAHENGLEWNVVLPQNGPWVIGDRTRLRQITLNLLSNAVKFTSEGQVELDVSVQGDEAVISVSDTGVGISQEDISRIFDEFYSSQDAVNSGKSGLGLGLAITKQLIERHNGRITVESPGKFGKGATFSFFLPIISEKRVDEELPVELIQKSNLVMILTEEDETSGKLLFYLEAEGFEIQRCRVDEDSEWLSKIIRMAPSAVILEEHLAVREGWAITGMIKRQAATANIPVLMYALDEQNDQGQILELNYLHKPLEPDQLAFELERIGGSYDGVQTVLIVDDDPGILDMHSRLIEQSGRRAVTARNGYEALEMVEEKIPDLILLDLMMPGMDGFAVLDELRSRESTRDIPVIILTARLLSDADLERCNQGVSAILTKGLFNTEETLEHLESALERQYTLNRATQQLIRKAMVYIHQHYTESITREKISEHIGISADYLTDCFRQELGITPIAYIRRYRIHQACEQLRSTDKNITEIALNVGFTDCAHFSRTFQREVGSTPRAYRRKKAA